ncbi:MAG TPA: permease prefix domain 1-containing protein [Streptosporangiaceae bacterium]
MTGTAVTGPDAPRPAADRAFGGYLAQIAGRLAGPAGTRRDILAELRAGLADAADSHRAAGLDPGQATRAAIGEFGSPDQVARGFRAELSAAQGRRTALALLMSAPLIALLWAAAALASHLGAPLAVPWHWAGMPAGARLASHIAMIALVTAIGGALVTVASSGRLTRWLPGRPAASAAVAAAGTAAVDLTLLGALAAQAASTPGRLAAVPVAAAAAASLARFSFAARSARTCLTACAA